MKKLFDMLTTKRYEENRQLLSFTTSDFLASTFEPADANCLDVSLQAEQVQRLFKLVQKIFGYHDYQVENPYKFHKLIPSARNIHPEIPYILFDGRAYRYDSVSNSFIYCGVVDDTDGFQVLIGLDLGRLCNVYGTFGLALSYLDMGHMIAELEVAVMDGHTEVEIVYMFDREKLQAELGIAKDIFLGSVLYLSNEQLEQETLYSAKEYNVPTERKQVDYSKDLKILGVTDYLNSFNKRFSYKRKGEALTASTQWSGARTSANSSGGLLDLGISLSETKWQQLLEVSSSIVNRYSGKGQFPLHILICNQDSEMNGYHRVRKEVIDFQSASLSLDNLLHDSKEFFNLEDASFAAFITYQGEQLPIQEQIYYAHVFSAEMIHHLSRFFFGENFYTRPMKNFNDAYLKQQFDLCEQDRVIYLLFAGKTLIGNRKYIL